METITSRKAPVCRTALLNSLSVALPRCFDETTPDLWRYMYRSLGSYATPVGSGSTEADTTAISDTRTGNITGKEASGLTSQDLTPQTRRRRWRNRNSVCNSVKRGRLRSPERPQNIWKRFTFYETGEVATGMHANTLYFEIRCPLQRQSRFRPWLADQTCCSL